jgi:hypothetical protein
MTRESAFVVEAMAFHPIMPEMSIEISPLRL